MITTWFKRIAISTAIAGTLLGALISAPDTGAEKPKVTKATPVVIVFSGIDGESTHKDHRGE